MPPQVQSISPQSEPAKDPNIAGKNSSLRLVAEQARQENRPGACVETALDPAADAEKLKSILTAAVPRQQKIENTEKAIADIAGRFNDAREAKAYLDKVSSELDKLFVASESDARNPENLLGQLLKQWRIDGDVIIKAATKAEKKPSAAALLKEDDVPATQPAAGLQLGQQPAAATPDLKSLNRLEGIQLIRQIWLNPSIDSNMAIDQIRKIAEALGYDSNSKRFRKEILKPALEREAVGRVLDTGYVDTEGRLRTYTRDDLVKLANRNGPGGDYETVFNGGKTISENNGLEAELNERLGRKSIGERILQKGARYVPGVGQFLDD